MSHCEREWSKKATGLFPPTIAQAKRRSRSRVNASGGVNTSRFVKRYTHNPERSKAYKEYIATCKSRYHGREDLQLEWAAKFAMHKSEKMEQMLQRRDAQQTDHRTEHKLEPSQTFWGAGCNDCFVRDSVIVDAIEKHAPEPLSVMACGRTNPQATSDQRKRCVNHPSLT